MTTPLMDDVDRFARRILVDCLMEQSRLYWLRRAEQFSAIGTSNCDEIAQACRNRAEVSRLGGDTAEYVALINEELGSCAGISNLG